MFFRKFLIRLLLLSLLFTAAVASPLHWATHMQHAAVGSGHAWSDLHASEAAGHEQDVDGLCAWCLSPALQTSGWPAPPTHLATTVMSRLALRQVPEQAILFMPSAGHWPFSSRDPPFA